MHLLDKEKQIKCWGIAVCVVGCMKMERKIRKNTRNRKLMGNGDKVPEETWLCNFIHFFVLVLHRRRTIISFKNDTIIN